MVKEDVEDFYEFKDEFKDVFAKSFCSPTFRLANSLVVLLSKCLLNLELIPVKGKMITENVKIQCIVFGHLWTLTTS